MVNVLRKLFIKDHQHLNDPKVRLAHGRLAAWLGILTNTVLFALKLGFGLAVMSIAIIGDAINNLSDLASSSVTLIGFWMANKPADKKHPFGHQRIEYIAGLIVSFIILALAVLLFSQSIEKIIANDILTFDDTFIGAMIILGIAVIFKLLQALFNFRLARLISSVTLKATAVDSLTDAIATSLLLICSLLSYFLQWNNIDGYVGLLMSVFILISGIKMIKETSSPLIGEAAQGQRVKEIVKAIEAYPGVLGTHDLVAHNYGPTKMFMTIHIEVDARVNVLESHELLDDIEAGIKSRFDVELTCHMDPIDIGNPKTVRLRKKAEDVLKEISKDLSMHDFRVVHGKKHTNVLFDVVVPYGSIWDKDQNILVKAFLQAMNEGEKQKINVIIHYDHPFIE